MPILSQAKSQWTLRHWKGIETQDMKFVKLFFPRHARGEGVDTTKVRTKFKAKEQARREERVEFANVQAARAEVSHC